MESSGGGHKGVDLLIMLLRVASTISLPMKEGVADKTSMSANELRVLMALGGEGALAGHELADITGLQPMNVSRALSGLADQGLVEQVIDSANRRRKPHRLTAKGTEAFGGLTPIFADFSSFLFSDLNQKERTTMLALLGKLASRIQKWNVD